MDDSISRQAAIDEICKACSMEEDFHRCDGYPETSSWCEYLVALRSLPSAERKGNWIAEGIYMSTKCSICGFTLENWMQGAFYNYCPNCGADMRGEEE